MQGFSSAPRRRTLTAKLSQGGRPERSLGFRGTGGLGSQLHTRNFGQPREVGAAPDSQGYFSASQGPPTLSQASSHVGWGSQRSDSWGKQLSQQQQQLTIHGDTDAARALSSQGSVEPLGGRSRQGAQAPFEATLAAKAHDEVMRTLDSVKVATESTIGLIQGAESRLAALVDRSDECTASRIRELTSSLSDKLEGRLQQMTDDICGALRTAVTAAVAKEVGVLRACITTTAAAAPPPVLPSTPAPISDCQAIVPSSAAAGATRRPSTSPATAQRKAPAGRHAAARSGGAPARKGGGGDSRNSNSSAAAHRADTYGSNGAAPVSVYSQQRQRRAPPAKAPAAARRGRGGAAAVAVPAVTRTSAAAAAAPSLEITLGEYRVPRRGRGGGGGGGGGGRFGGSSDDDSDGDGMSMEDFMRGRRGGGGRGGGGGGSGGSRGSSGGKRIKVSLQLQPAKRRRVSGDDSDLDVFAF